jgi:MinD-like ATPase involved in chromosome partitioning or flagellar assembly
VAVAPPPSPERGLARDEVYREPVVDGRDVWGDPLTRLRARAARLLTTRGEREEAGLEAKLRAPRALTRTNTLAVVSPKGGVGKTTCTFLVGDLLATRLNLRCVAVDANPDFGTLGALAPDSVRTSASLADLVAHLDRVHSAAELHPFVSRLPSGLHLLAAPPQAEVMAQMTPELYGQLTAFLGRFYEVVLLDLGTGITDPLARFGVERADQAIVVTTPEYVTASSVLGALRHLDGAGGGARLTVVLNQAVARRGADTVDEAFRRQAIGRRVTIPYDRQLRRMLDSGTYSLGALPRDTRMSIKQLGLAVSEQLV